jgi:hypothetical protein
MRVSENLTAMALHATAANDSFVAPATKRTVRDKWVTLKGNLIELHSLL